MRQIISDPPVVVPIRDLAEGMGYSLETRLGGHSHTAPVLPVVVGGDRRLLLERFELVDVARKVVGVGSVGTRAWIVLLRGRDGDDPLFLQVKEATRSVLEDHLPQSRYRQPGERVVQGQRLMQAASDIFLGWTKAVVDDRYYYWRQLRDMKGSALVDSFDPAAMNYYASICGWTLARAHARSGDPVAITSYLGRGDRFDRSMTVFAERYADLNEQRLPRVHVRDQRGAPRGVDGGLATRARTFASDPERALGLHSLRARSRRAPQQDRLVRGRSPDCVINQSLDQCLIGETSVGPKVVDVLKESAR